MSLLPQKEGLLCLEPVTTEGGSVAEGPVCLGGKLLPKCKQAGPSRFWYMQAPWQEQSEVSDMQEGNGVVQRHSSSLVASSFISYMRPQAGQREMSVAEPCIALQQFPFETELATKGNQWSLQKKAGGSEGILPLTMPRRQPLLWGHQAPLGHREGDWQY